MAEKENLEGLDNDYWSERWARGETGWDVGYATTPLKTFIEQLSGKDMQILVPGAGNAYEGILLHQLGFRHTDILDISPNPLAAIHREHPEIPENCLVHSDFFAWDKKYDLILEQTFFCAIRPSLRRKYFEQCHKLLKPGGMLAGVLFDDKLNDDHPPFGGNAGEYRNYFKGLFAPITYETCYNSIKPRAGRELFIRLKKIE